KETGGDPFESIIELRFAGSSEEIISLRIEDFFKYGSFLEVMKIKQLGTTFASRIW
ncbi:unnamed protein product, partial [Allacma fusca]